MPAPVEEAGSSGAVEYLHLSIFEVTVGSSHFIINGFYIYDGASFPGNAISPTAKSRIANRHLLGVFLERIVHFYPVAFPESIDNRVAVAYRPGFRLPICQ